MFERNNFCFNCWLQKCCQAWNAAKNIALFCYSRFCHQMFPMTQNNRAVTVEVPNVLQFLISIIIYSGFFSLPLNVTVIFFLLLTFMHQDTHWKLSVTWLSYQIHVARALAQVIADWIRRSLVAVNWMSGGKRIWRDGSCRNNNVWFSEQCVKEIIIA